MDARGIGLRIVATAVAATAVACLAYALPLIVLDEGVEQLTTHERLIAEKALLNAHVACIDHPITQIWTRRIRVQSLRRDPQYCRGRKAAGVLNDYRVVLRAHTFFGVPYGHILVCGGETICDSKSIEDVTRDAADTPLPAVAVLTAAGRPGSCWRSRG